MYAARQIIYETDTLRQWATFNNQLKHITIDIQNWITYKSSSQLKFTIVISLRRRFADWAELSLLQIEEEERRMKTDISLSIAFSFNHIVSYPNPLLSVKPIDTKHIQFSIEFFLFVIWSEPENMGTWATWERVGKSRYPEIICAIPKCELLVSTLCTGALNTERQISEHYVMKTKKFFFYM